MTIRICKNFKTGFNNKSGGANTFVENRDIFSSEYTCLYKINAFK